MINIYPKTVCANLYPIISYGSESEFSKSRRRTFMKYDVDVQHLCQMSLLTFERLRSKFKVKTVILKIFHMQ